MADHVLRIAKDDARPIPRRINLTEAGLSRLTCPPGKNRTHVYDADVKGLTVQVTKNDARSFYYYGRVKGELHPIRYHIGEVGAVSLKDARTRAKKIGSDAAMGINPAAERKAAVVKARLSISIKELWEAYRDQHLKVHGRASTLRTDESRYDLHLSVWAAKRVDQITSDDVRELHQSLTVKKTGNVADKAVKLLRRMLSWHKVEPNPAARAVKFHGDKQRERFLTQDEISKLVIELNKAFNQTAADVIRFALLCGARKGNVRTARWADIHLDQAAWIVPADQSKNKKPMRINLPAAAVDLLKQRKASANRGDVYVFPGRVAGRPVAEVKGTWYTVRKAAGIEDVRFHDIRHTLGAWLAMSGASLQFIGQQLGHANKQSSARYSHLEASAVAPITETAIAAMMGAKKPHSSNADARKGKATGRESSKAGKQGRGQ